MLLIPHIAKKKQKVSKTLKVYCNFILSVTWENISNDLQRLQPLKELWPNMEGGHNVLFPSCSWKCLPHQKNILSWVSNRKSKLPRKTKQNRQFGFVWFPSSKQSLKTGTYSTYQRKLTHFKFINLWTHSQNKVKLQVKLEFGNNKMLPYLCFLNNV